MYYVHKHKEYLRFEVLTMISMKTVVLWDVTVCNLIPTFLIHAMSIRLRK